MFLKKPESASDGESDSVIDAGIAIDGDLRGSGSVTVNGVFTGTLDCGVLIIGRGGRIEGLARAEEARIEGAFDGEIHAATLKLRNSAVVVGTLYYGTMLIEDGAQVDGRFHHSDAQPAPIPARLSHQTRGAEETAQPLAAPLAQAPPQP